MRGLAKVSRNAPAERCAEASARASRLTAECTMRRGVWAGYYAL